MIVLRRSSYVNGFVGTALSAKSKSGRPLCAVLADGEYTASGRGSRSRSVELSSDPKSRSTAKVAGNWHLPRVRTEDRSRASRRLLRPLAEFQFPVPCATPRVQSSPAEYDYVTLGRPLAARVHICVAGMNPSQNPEAGINNTPRAHSPPNPQAKSRESFPPDNSKRCSTIPAKISKKPNNRNQTVAMRSGSASAWPMIPDRHKSSSGAEVEPDTAGSKPKPAAAPTT
jgi:hypothetical protein